MEQETELASSARKYWSEGGWAPGGVIREVDYVKASKGLPPELAGIKIVDCDTHFSEPPDLFISRAPAKYKDRAPVQRRVNGNDRWFVDGRDFGSTGGNVIRKDNNKLLGRMAFPTMEEGHPGAWELKPRLQAMDDMGIYAQICYHNSGVTQAGALMALRDEEFALWVISTYNDAAAQRQVESGQRLFPVVMLPTWNQKALMAEAQRCVDMGLKAFVMPDLPERLGVPAYTEPYWDPFFDLCEKTGTPINFHLNAAIDPNAFTYETFGFEQKLAVVSMMFAVCNAATLGNLIVSGILDRHPKLKIGLIESGMGWVPFVLESMEHQFDEMLPKELSSLQRRPWEYFRDNFWVTYWFETIGPKQLLETIGVDKVLFETDFPHPTSLYPGVQEHLVKTLGGYDYAVRKKVLETNAVKLYNLPF
ncbi:MAG TPA: amidohydrolase family protein [Sphingobium sp.]|nr:amidohydrolase family protein [Sphingobium sp.]